MEKEKIALVEINIDRTDWGIGVGHNTSYKCNIPFDVCKKLLEMFEMGDEDCFEELKSQYSEFLEEYDSLESFEYIFERNMVGEETNTYIDNDSEISYEEYSEILENGFNHECANMCISDLNSDDFAYVELYGG